MTTSEPQSTGGEENPDQLSMWSVEAFPVRTSPTRAARKASRVAAPVSGRTCVTSFAEYDPGTSSWRTSQLSLAGDSTSLPQTWPRAGMTSNGTAYRRRPSAPITRETDGSALPTPSASSYGTNRSPSPGASVRPSLETMARHGLWPTPRAGADRSSRKALTVHRSAPSLAQAVELAEGIVPREVDSMAEAPPSWRRMWATPIARDARSFKGAARSPNAQGGEPLTVQAGGTLNPTWVEWLMGFPLGWTDLDDTPSETPSSPRSPNTSAG